MIQGEAWQALPTAGMTHGLLDGLVHIDKAKSLEENLYNIGYQANVEGFYGALYGVGWSAAVQVK